jgi:hypothetical protein
LRREFNKIVADEYRRRLGRHAAPRDAGTLLPLLQKQTDTDKDWLLPFSLNFWFSSIWPRRLKVCSKVCSKICKCVVTAL